MPRTSGSVRSELEPLTEPESGDGERVKPPSLWRNHDYLSLWTGEAVSSLGTSMSAIAYPLLVLFATGSVARAGIVTAAGMIGTVVMLLWGGVLADRVSRKTLLVCGPLGQAIPVAVVALLVVHHHTPIVALAAAAGAGGLAGECGTRRGFPRCAASCPKSRWPWPPARSRGATSRRSSSAARSPACYSRRRGAYRSSRTRRRSCSRRSARP